MGHDLELKAFYTKDIDYDAVFLAMFSMEKSMGARTGFEPSISFISILIYNIHILDKYVGITYGRNKDLLSYILCNNLSLLLYCVYFRLISKG